MLLEILPARVLSSCTRMNLGDDSIVSRNLFRERPLPVWVDCNFHNPVNLRNKSPIVPKCQDWNCNWIIGHRWQRRAKAAQEVEYPAYGITGPGPSPSGKSSLKSSPSSTTPGGGIGSWTLGKTPKSMASSGDKKLAHSAHMFHFQHQKQQVIALERYVIYDGRNPNHKCLLTYFPLL